MDRRSTFPSLRCCWRCRSSLVADAQRRGRGFFDDPHAHAGELRRAFNFCRIAFSTAAWADGGGTGPSTIPRRHQPLDPAVGAHQDRDQHRRRRRAQPSRRPLTDPELFQCPFIMMTEVGTRLLQPGRRAAAARVPAEGRLPVGRRLLGLLRLGELGVGVQQGAAAERVPDARSAARSSDVPHAVHRQARAADSIDQPLDELPAARRSAAPTAPSRTRAASPTQKAGCWCSSPTTPISATRGSARATTTRTSTPSRSNGYAFGINTLLYAMTH